MNRIEDFENNVSREVGMQVLRNRYGNVSFTSATVTQVWDFKMDCPITSMTVEMKFRDGYTMEQMDNMGGPCVELKKAINPENKNTVLLCVSADGVCRMRDITGYTRTSKAEHQNKTKSDDNKTVVTDWAYYTEWDDEWVDTSVRAKYQEEKNTLLEMARQLVKERRNRDD